MTWDIKVVTVSVFTSCGIIAMGFSRANELNSLYNQRHDERLCYTRYYIASELIP